MGLTVCLADARVLYEFPFHGFGPLANRRKPVTNERFPSKIGKPFLSNAYRVKV